MYFSLPDTTFIEITKQGLESLFSFCPSHQEYVVFIPIILKLGVLLSLRGTGLGTITTGTQEQIKANTNLSTTLS